MPADSKILHDNRTELHYCVDEAGDPTLFSAKGKVLIGEQGCSKFFIMGKLEIAAPDQLAKDLAVLRSHVLSDPFLKTVPSMLPEAQKSALMFHAKDDIPEVRHQVFLLLQRHALRFFAVVREKQELLAYVREENKRTPTYRYRENEIYNTLVRQLFEKLHGQADVLHICFAMRGQKDRTKALRAALEQAELEFEKNFGFKRKATVHVTAKMPYQNPGLQAVDYFLWALQRFYERGEERYISAIWNQVTEIHDLDFLGGGKNGTFFGKQLMLSLKTRVKKG